MTRLTKLERRIVAANNGRPWTLADIRAIDPRWSADRYADVRYAVGMTHAAGQWVTTDNGKMNKDADGIGAGITYAPATELRELLTARTDGAPVGPRMAPVRWEFLARLVGASMGATIGAGPVAVIAAAVIALLRGFNPCPWATPGCTAGCVIRTGGNGRYRSAVAGRSARLLTLVLYPAAAMRLTLDGMTAWQAEHGAAARWRWGVGDDIRWELVCPELFDLAATMGGYLYTKAPVAQRPSSAVAVTVRSATGERSRWTVADIVAAVGRGERVAVVVNVNRGRPLPLTWHGMPVIDGDATDDRTKTPAGSVVLLRWKGTAVGTAVGRGSFVFDLFDGGAVWADPAHAARPAGRRRRPVTAGA